MLEVVNITELRRAKVLMNPIRIRLLRSLVEPRTCAELAAELGLSQQRINNHLKALLEIRVIRIAKRRRVRNLIEATYQAVGKAYWLSPRLVRDPEIADARFRDELSLDNLLVLSEDVQHSVANLLGQVHGHEVPSLGLSVEVVLESERTREAFTKDILDALAPVLEKYERSASHPGPRYKTVVMAFPSADEPRG